MQRLHPAKRAKPITFAPLESVHLVLRMNSRRPSTSLNRAGTTFRKLDDAAKTDLVQDKAISLMLAQPSIIMRPVLDLGDRTLLGFKPELYAQALA